jgi:hypothetical protein
MTCRPKNKPAEKSRPVPKKERIFFARGLIQTSFFFVSGSINEEFGGAVAVPFFPLRLGSREPALPTKYTTCRETLSTALLGEEVVDGGIPGDRKSSGVLSGRENG